jgi:hypothetical protein
MEYMKKIFFLPKKNENWFQVTQLNRLLRQQSAHQVNQQKDLTIFFQEYTYGA